MRTGSTKLKKKKKFHLIMVQHTKFLSDPTNATRDIARKPSQMAAIMDFRPFEKFSEAQTGPESFVTIGAAVLISDFGSGVLRNFQKFPPGPFSSAPGRTLKSKILARSE